MTAIRHIAGLNTFDLDDRRISLAIGMFDGVHIGHKRVFDSALRAASKLESEAGALVFWPHPSRLFRPEDPTLMISTPDMKRKDMERRGLRFVIEEPFTRELALIEAEQFIDFLKTHLPGLASVHVGENWRFGRGRLGDANLLVKIAEASNVEAHVAKSAEMGADRLSSTRIREALLDGRIEDANEMLGHAYRLRGTVQEGKRLGRQIGVPTLNIPFLPELAPKLGVYAGEVTKVGVEEKPFPAVFNIGVRPTVETGDRTLVEAHVLSDECPIFYGDEIEAVFTSFLRPELKFDGVESLRLQIANDVRRAKEILNFKVDA